MGPDYWFVAAGAIAVGVALVILAVALRRRDRRGLPKGSLWLTLGVGLLLQGFAPHVPIRDGAFAIPAVSEAARSVDPIGLVNRTRGMYQLSLLATLIGALGLAACYRRQLFELRDDRNA